MLLSVKIKEYSKKLNLGRRFARLGFWSYGHQKMAQCSKTQNAVSFDPFMVEMWAKGQFHYLKTCCFQIWCCF